MKVITTATIRKSTDKAKRAIKLAKPKGNELI